MNEIEENYGKRELQTSPQTSLIPALSNIHHAHKVATPLQLKRKEKTKLKLTPSHFLRYNLTTWTTINTV